MALTEGGLFRDITTGDIDLLGGGINIGNHSSGPSDAQIASIFNSLAAQNIAESQQEQEQSSRRSQLLIIVGSTSLVALFLILIIFFTNKTPKP